MSNLRVRFLGTLDMRVDAQQLSRPPTLKSQSLLPYRPIAEALRTVLPILPSSELTYHFEQGRKLDEALTDKAITYLPQAGERAAQQSANIDDEERRRSFLEQVWPHREIVREFNIGSG